MISLMRIDLYNLYLLQWRFRKIYVHHTLSYMPKPDRNRGNVLKVHTRVPGLLYRVVHYEVPGCICRMYPAGTSIPAGALRILPMRVLVHTLVRMTYLACAVVLQTSESCYLHIRIICRCIHIYTYMYGIYVSYQSYY